MSIVMGVTLLFILAYRLKYLINPLSAGYWWKLKELNVFFTSVAISTCIFISGLFLFHPYMTCAGLWLLLMEFYWTYKLESSISCCESKPAILKKFESIEMLRNARQAYVVCLLDTTELDEIICLITRMPESSPAYDELALLNLDRINIKQMVEKDRVSNKESLMSLIYRLKHII